MKTLGKIAFVAIPLSAILAAAARSAAGAWISVSGPPMPASGYIAMALVIGFSLVLGCGLTALLFYSSRHGCDEPYQAEDDRGGQSSTAWAQPAGKRARVPDAAVLSDGWIEDFWPGTAAVTLWRQFHGVNQQDLNFLPLSRFSSTTRRTGERAGSAAFPASTRGFASGLQQ